MIKSYDEYERLSGKICLGFIAVIISLIVIILTLIIGLILYSLFHLLGFEIGNSSLIFKFALWINSAIISLYLLEKSIKLLDLHYGK